MKLFRGILWLGLIVSIIAACSAPVTTLPKVRPLSPVAGTILSAPNGTTDTAVQVIFHNAKENLFKIGSGVFVRVQGEPDSVYVLTAAHVAAEYHVPGWKKVEDPNSIIMIRTKEGGMDSVLAKMIAYDIDLDVSLIKLKYAKSANYPHYAKLNVDNLNTGDYVYTVGNPLTYKYLFTEGVIATDDYLPLSHTYITTVPVDRGSSGGGLFDENGDLVGIVILKVQHESGFLPLSAATKSIQISKWLNSIGIVLE